MRQCVMDALIRQPEFPGSICLFLVDEGAGGRAARQADHGFPSAKILRRKAMPMPLGDGLRGAKGREAPHSRPPLYAELVRDTVIVPGRVPIGWDGHRHCIVIAWSPAEALTRPRRGWSISGSLDRARNEGSTSRTSALLMPSVALRRLDRFGARTDRGPAQGASGRSDPCTAAIHR